MQIVHRVAELRAALAGCRNTVLVPTMGNLHQGHLSLLELARAHGTPVVTSLFVNRLQFGPSEDFARYPRTAERDYAMLAEARCDIAFAPQEHEVYPEAQAFTVHPPANLANILEGATRPGFFIGVATVVTKLFNMVLPAKAVFGKKDYQQLLVIEHLVRQLALPIDIVRATTVRDAHGLALSSRNGYLDADQLVHAAQLHAALERLVRKVREGRSDWRILEAQADRELADAGWVTDYVAIRRRSDLGEPRSAQPLIALAAARLGSTRLIDNLEI